VSTSNYASLFNSAKRYLNRTTCKTKIKKCNTNEGELVTQIVFLKFAAYGFKRNRKAIGFNKS